MSTSDVTREGLRGERPGREARMWEKGRGSERPMVPRATFASYYGRPILKRPVWQERDIAGYLFTGGIAAGSAMVGAGGEMSGRPALRRVGRLGAVTALGVSAYALVHDLGVRSRFHHMLRVAKPTSPMSVGSWLLSAFALPVGVAAAAELPGVVPRPLRGLVRALERPASVGSAVVAPAVATYTAVLLSDTAVPSWHAAYPELPFVFAGSALTGSAGLALAFSPCAQSQPVRRLALLGSALELGASQRIERRLDLLGEPYREGAAGRKMRGGKAMTTAGVALTTVFGARSRTAAVVGGLTLLAASALTRFGIFEAGVASTQDPKYVVTPQRDRLASSTRSGSGTAVDDDPAHR